MLQYDDEEVKYAICDRYTAEEIVEILNLSSEDIYDTYKCLIKENISNFELINLDTGFFFTDYEDEREKNFTGITETIEEET